MVLLVDRPLVSGTVGQHMTHGLILLTALRTHFHFLYLGHVLPQLHTAVLYQHNKRL